MGEIAVPGRNDIVIQDYSAKEDANVVPPPPSGTTNVGEDQIYI